jgi:membrane fusion protein (multidrug efflux system)
MIMHLIKKAEIFYKNIKGNNMKNKNAENGKQKKNGLKIYIPVIIVVLIVIAGGYYWYKDYMRYISTDDAFIDADRVSVSSKMLGRITRLYFDEGDTVKAGQLLAELDSTDLVAQKNQSVALIRQAEASKVQAEARLAYDKESIGIQEISVEKATEDYNRAQEQFKGNVIPKEQYDHALKSLQTAQAQLKAAQSQLNVSRAMVGSAQAAVESAKAQVGVIESQLRNTRLISPSNGIIARRWLLPGDIAQPGQSIFTIYDSHAFWVEINLEETKLSHIRLDQPVIFTVDAFPGATFRGKVIFIGSNTASQFSLIPPNNASGNFTKITQRVELKVSIESAEGGKDLKEYTFLAGMSVAVKIIKD